VSSALPKYKAKKRTAGWKQQDCLENNSDNTWDEIHTKLLPFLYLDDFGEFIK
jgi:hypothetical protein